MHKICNATMNTTEKSEATRTKTLANTMAEEARKRGKRPHTCSHGCLSALSTVSRFFGSTVRSFRIRSMAVGGMDKGRGGRK